MFYLELFGLLSDAGVRYLVAGGVALNLHGVPRMTADLDLALALDAANVEAMLSVLGEYGMVASLPVAVREVLDPEKRRQWLEEKGLVAFPLHHPGRPFEAVDLLINVPFDFEALWQRRLDLTVEGTRVPVVSAEDLRIAKRAAGRPQDLADVDALERLLQRKGGAR